MKSLILVAHGSRRQASNQEIKVLAESLAQQGAAEQYDQVSYAYLELAVPSLSDVLEQHVQLGMDDICVLPYFLAAGRHVGEDIPRVVEEVNQRYPTAHIHIASYLGQAAEMTGFLLNHLSRQSQSAQASAHH